MTDKSTSEKLRTLSFMFFLEKTGDPDDALSRFWILYSISSQTPTI